MFRYFSNSLSLIKINTIEISRRGLKKQVKTQFIRVEYPGANSPLVSGDCAKACLPDLSEPSPIFKDLKEYHELPDELKPIFSIGHVKQRYAVDVYIEELKNRVRKHIYDEDSLEVKIARSTARIRYFQDCFQKKPKNGRLIEICKILIDKRKKNLKLLRQSDYKSFENVLEKLELTYKPMPEDNTCPTEKKSMVKLVDLECEQIRKKKMEEYKNSLIQERDRLLKEYANNPL